MQLHDGHNNFEASRHCHETFWDFSSHRRTNQPINTQIGEPVGQLIKVAGKWDAYLASPAPDRARTGKGILFCPDAMGLWQNTKLLADQFAANGYLTLAIDEFNGDPLELNRPANFDFTAWLNHGSDGKNPHTKEAVDPIIVAAIKTLKEEYGIDRVGAVGYCFGAKVGECTTALFHNASSIVT